MRHPTRSFALLCIAHAVVPLGANAQWTNRYPKVAGYGHHVYLEGYELPTLAAGPLDAAMSPDGGSIAFSARGWLWILDAETGEARRVTSGGEMDFRPAWSPDGRQLVFVRDDGRDTKIAMLDVASGNERVVLNTPAIDLDPVFSSDGTQLWYASAVAGDLDIWRLTMDTGDETRVTTQRGLELLPQPTPDGAGLVYLSKRGAGDEVRLHDIATGEERVLERGNILSMTRPRLSPDGRTLVFGRPTQRGWELRVTDVAAPAPSVLLADGKVPISPSWTSDGSAILFSEADGQRRMSLKRVSTFGGRVEPVAVRSWKWNAPTATVRVKTRKAGQSGYAAARLAIVDGNGHPAVPTETAPHFDGQNGRVFVYSPGVLDVTIPAGEFRIGAVQGLATPEATVVGRAEPGSIHEVTLDLSVVWNAIEDGWISGDHHFHLNYGGQYDLAPDIMVPMMKGEALDMATPLLANLHNRFEDQDLWTWERSGQLPMIRFAQEIRSHFLGHLALLGTDDLFWPWVWGPGYQVYGGDDRANSEALRFARDRGGMGVYVHPVFGPRPFDEDQIGGLPIELIPDAVLGDLDGLEVACLWSDEIGTSRVWYRFLNLGIPIAQTAGTDVMNNLYRTMAVGTTRVYVYTNGATNWPTYLAALRAGRSFVTNGPLLDFRVDGMKPGEFIARASSAEWNLDLHSAVPVERVEVVVNGDVVWTGSGIETAGTQSYSGRIDVPTGGWIAARAEGGTTIWPSMDSYAFAHTSPVWIDSVGTTDAESMRSAAAELLRGLDAAEQRLLAGYAGRDIPNLKARFDEARARLVALSR